MRISAWRAELRLGIGAAWGLVMFALVWGLPLLGAVLTDQADATAVRLGVPLAGLVLAIVVCGWARQWIQRLRRARLGPDAITATATVERVDVYRTSGRAPNRTIYTVWFSWTEPGGARRVHERQYGFFASGLRAFEARVTEGTQAPIHYPAGRPHRFIVDIPYTPTMADQFL